MQGIIFLRCLLIIIGLYFLNTSFGIAQNIGYHPPKFYIDSLNRYYYQAKMPVYIYISHDPNSKPVQLGRELNNQIKNDYQPFQLDGHGKHYLHHDEHNGLPSDKFAVYADNIAPKTLVEFIQAPKFTQGNTIFYGKNLKVILKALDEMSGVENYFYSVNGENYQSYNQTLSFNSEGNQILKYYAVDHVGNIESENIRNFIVDLTPPITYHNIVGINEKSVVSTTTKIYLTKSDAISGVAKTFYRIDSSAYKPYLGGNIIISNLIDGNHTLEYYSIDQVNNIEKKKSVTFYLDKTAPIMSADILGDKFIANDIVYFSGRTKLKITAVDNKAGLKQVQYSIDNQPYQVYQDPFYLPKESGFHYIKYFAEDNTLNKGIGENLNTFEELVHTVGAVYVDLNGPVLSNDFMEPKFQKGDTLIISSKTNLQLFAKDMEAGVKSLGYYIDGNEEIENKYIGPFNLNLEGYHTISIVSYDNVNNRNIKPFSFFIDNTPPLINHAFSVDPVSVKENIKVYPHYCKIFLSATDQMTDCRDIRYKINNKGKEILYTGAINGFKKKENYIITVIATDVLGNRTEYEIKFRTEKY